MRWLEGIHLCNVERNGDVVEMTSYAPLLCKDGYGNWQPDMIYFDNNNVRASESYKMQKMYGQHAGDLYISSVLSLPDALKKYVGTSVVKDSKSGKTWLKVVNALPLPYAETLGFWLGKHAGNHRRQASGFRTLDFFRRCFLMKRIEPKMAQIIHFE